MHTYTHKTFLLLCFSFVSPVILSFVHTFPLLLAGLLSSPCSFSHLCFFSPSRFQLGFLNPRWRPDIPFVLFNAPRTPLKSASSCMHPSSKVVVSVHRLLSSWPARSPIYAPPAISIRASTELSRSCSHQTPKKNISPGGFERARRNEETTHPSLLIQHERRQFRIEVREHLAQR